MTLATGVSALTANPFVESAAAQETVEEPLKIIVGKLSGAKPTSARNWIVEGLEADSRFEVVGDDSLSSSASEGEIASLASEKQADAVILGKSVFGWSAQLRIYDGSDGTLIQEVEIPRGSFAEYEDQLVGGAAYFGVLQQAKGFPPEPPVEEVAAEPLDDEPPAEGIEEEETGEKPRPSPLDISIGVRGYSRGFRYTDTLQQLGQTDEPYPPDYNLSFGPMPFAQLHWYPMAHFMGGFPAHLGITGGYERGLGTNVNYQAPSITPADQAQGPQEFGQSHQLWYVGLRGRIPVSMFTFGLNANFGSHSFKLLQKDATVDPSNHIPGVDYRFLEFGGDVEVQVGKVLAGGQGSYILPLAYGQIKSDAWFPETKGSGVHFGAHVGYEVVPYLDFLFGIDGRIYGLDFNPLDDLAARADLSDANTDPRKGRVAGGATDKYMSVYLALRFVIPGSGQSEAAASSEDSGGEESFDSFDSFD